MQLDWLAEPDAKALGSFPGHLESAASALAHVDFAPLAGLPPPVLGRPYRLGGSELRVLRKTVLGDSLQFEPSVFWKLFLALRPNRHKLLYRAFCLDEALAPQEWTALLGDKSLEMCRELAVLGGVDSELKSSLKIIHTGRSALVLDQGAGVQKVYCGRDSLMFLKFCLGEIDHSPRTSYLDVGTGAGALLCGLAPIFDRAIGIDLNPRAVHLARANVVLNKLSHVMIQEADVFEFNKRGLQIGRAHV